MLHKRNINKRLNYWYITLFFYRCALRFHPNSARALHERKCYLMLQWIVWYTGVLLMSLWCAETWPHQFNTLETFQGTLGWFRILNSWDLKLVDTAYRIKFVNYDFSPFQYTTSSFAQLHLAHLLTLLNPFLKLEIGVCCK